MKPDKLKHSNFISNREKTLEIQHFDGCNYKFRNVPINECPCDCYVEQIFILGMEAQERLFNGSDR